MIQILLAFLAGILTIAAPCILLPLPIIFGTSVGQQSKTRPLFITGGFVLTFAVLGITLNFLVQHLGLSPNALRLGAIILLAIFSVFMIWPTPFERLMTHMSGLINRANDVGKQAGTGNVGGFVIGIILGIIWAPCAGPILGSILTLIAREESSVKAGLQLLAYALGAGLPMLLIAYGGQALTTKIRGIAKYGTKLQQIFGVILLLLAVAIYFQYDTVIQAKLLDKFPNFGSSIEKSLVKSLQKSDSSTTPSSQINILPTPASQNNQNATKTIKLENLGPAPEFTGITNWLNTDHALTMKELRGKVVLVDFWTYSCINCIRTLPYVTKWYDTYKDKGFVVVGVHTPEFAFEKVVGNIQTAIGHHNIHYPVAVDSDYGTWNAYSNEYWPAEYLIDKDGNIVHTHFGEGEYDQTEMAIKQLLGLNGGATVDKGANLSKIKSPEMYFGLSRLAYFSGPTPSNNVQTYVIPNRLDLNKFALEGKWKFDGEKTTLAESPGKIKLHFNSAKVHMVANSNKTMSITARVDNYPARIIQIQGSDLYTIFDSEDYGDHVLEITIPDAGFEAFTFTFG